MIFISQPVNCCHFSRQAGKIVLRPFMSVLIILIAVSLLVAISFLAAFFWAVRSGQYDDDYAPGVRMLFDNETITENKSTTTDNK